MWSYSGHDLRKNLCASVLGVSASVITGQV